MKAVNLETKRLFLERLTLKHLSKKYVDWLNDPEVYKFLESGGDYSIKKLEEYLAEQEQKDIFFWAILTKKNFRHIGNIKIDPLDVENNSGEYGILIGDKTQWGKGYAVEASLKVFQYCFEKIKLSKVTLGVIKNNVKAIKSYEKMGFVVEPIIRTKGLYDGKLNSTIRMVLRND
jgi:RimJ/RimL family protein N-acetyltransferase